MTLCPWPNCGHRLEGLEAFCHSCMRYADDYRPEDAKPFAKKNEDPRSEKEIQQAVKNALRAMGFGIWDTSQPFEAKITPGLPDLFVVGRGLMAWVEVKSATGRQSPAQAAFQRAVEENGGIYLLTRHESEVIEWAEGRLWTA